MKIADTSRLPRLAVGCIFGIGCEVVERVPGRKLQDRYQSAVLFGTFQRLYLPAPGQVTATVFFDKFVDVRRVLRYPAIVRDLYVGGEIYGHFRYSYYVAQRRCCAEYLEPAGKPLMLSSPKTVLGGPVSGLGIDSKESTLPSNLERVTMPNAGYKQFCPLAMAAEVLCTRWTMVLLREMIAGSTRFNDLRRGVPRMSPTLLSQRLKDLEAAGVVEKKPVPSERGVFEYRLTDAGQDLREVVISMGMWGQKWVESSLSLKNLDPSLLMWDMRRNLNPDPLPKQRVVIQFIYHDLPSTKQNWWLVIEAAGDVDLCWADPGFEVDLYVSTDLRTMTAIWMGVTDVASEADKFEFTGAREISNSIQTWLGLSPFAVQRKLVA